MTPFANNLFRTTYLRSALVFVAAAGLALAQNQPPVNPQAQPVPGGWRRVGDPPPAQPPVSVPANQSQDPSEPVDRSDQSGQPAQNGPQPGYPAAQPPNYQGPQPGYQDPQPGYQDPPPGYQGPQNPPPGPPAARQNDRPTYNRPAYRLPREVTLQPGTFVTIRTNQPLSSDHNQPGDTFSATLAQPVVVDGIVVAQRGQTVYGRVAEAQKAHSNNSSRLGLELTSMTLADGTQVPVRSQLVARQGTTAPGGEQAGTVAATTVVGAAVGGMADYGRGAAIGAGVGATAGIIGVLLTRNRPTIVYPETALTFRIESPVTVSTVRAPQAFRYVGPDEYDRGYNAQLHPRPAAPPAPYYYGPSYYPYYPYYWGPSVS
ncbi:MAG TPA: hypothetical protein VGH38_13175, partial [Bryobacteraceae bacterium]